MKNNKKNFKETFRHGTLDLPIGIHHYKAPPGSETVLYLHWHEEFELFYIYKGGTIFYIDNEPFVVKEGQCMFIHSQQLHYAKPLDNLCCEFYAIVFHSNFFSDSMNQVMFTRYIKPILSGSVSFPPLISGTEPEQKKALSIIQEVSLLFEKELSDYDLLIKARLLELWYLLFTNLRNVKKAIVEMTYKHERLDAVKDYISKNYSYDISLKTLADIIALSEGQFCRTFKETIGVTPIVYITRHRILRSCELLVSTNKKISEIASDVGFNNVSYYNRAFLSILECTPTQYRKRFWQQ